MGVESAKLPMRSAGIKQSAAFLLVISLTVLLAYYSAQLFWLLSNDLTVLDSATVRHLTPPSPSDSFTSTKQNSLLLLSTIKSRHIFGQQDNAVLSPSLVVDKIPETRLNLRLHGVLSSTIPERSIAMISVNNSKEKQYNKYDTLPGGVSIIQILTDRVLLERDQKVEALLIPNSAFAPDSNMHTSPLPIKQIRTKLQQAPWAILQFVTIQPHHNNGKLTGYSVAPGKDPSLFRQTGLRKGDMIRSVNGIDTADMVGRLDLVQSFLKAERITLVIERAGLDQELIIDLTP